MSTRARGSWRGRSRVKGLFKKDIWYCDCNPRYPVNLYQVKGGENKGRWFYTCRNEQEDGGGCGFFLWTDDAEIREEIAPMNDSESNVDPRETEDAGAAPQALAQEEEATTSREKQKEATPPNPSPKPDSGRSLTYDTAPSVALPSISSFDYGQPLDPAQHAELQMVSGPASPHVSQTGPIMAEMQMQPGMSGPGRPNAHASAHLQNPQMMPPNIQQASEFSIFAVP